MGIPTVKNILLISAYITILYWVVYKLSFTWAYQGIYFYMPSLETVVFSLLMAIIPLFFIKKKLRLPSDYISFYIYIFTFIPSVSVPFVLINPTYLNGGYYVFVMVFLVALVYLLRESKLRSNPLFFIKEIPRQMLPIVGIMVYLLSFILFISAFGLNFTIPDLTDVYDVRAQYKEITQGNIITRYFVGWMGYIVNIFLLLYALRVKNYKLLIFSIIFQLYIFSLMALKSHVATYILAAMLFFVFEKYKTLSSGKFLQLTVVFILSLSIIDFVIGNDFFEMLITRRIMVIPSQLTYYHFDFFNENQKTVWAFSVLKGLVDYPYHLPPPNLIGEKHFGNENTTAVVNLFIEGYTALGYIGVIIVTLILKYLLRIIDYIFLNKSGEDTIIIIIVLGLCNIINSTSVFTMLLTHGWLVLILLINVFPWRILKK